MYDKPKASILSGEKLKAFPLKSGKLIPPVPFFFRNAFNFSPLRIMFAVGLSYIAFIMLRYVPSIPAFWRVFYHKWMLNFVKGLLCIYWDNHMVFIFQFVNVVNYIDWFVDIEESLHVLGKNVSSRARLLRVWLLEPPFTSQVIWASYFILLWYRFPTSINTIKFTRVVVSLNVTYIGNLKGFLAHCNYIMVVIISIKKNSKLI